jgi:hypothetical protein
VPAIGPLVDEAASAPVTDRTSVVLEVRCVPDESGAEPDLVVVGHEDEHGEFVPLSTLPRSLPLDRGRRRVHRPGDRHVRHRWLRRVRLVRRAGGGIAMTTGWPKVIVEPRQRVIADNDNGGRSLTASGSSRTTSCATAWTSGV